MAAVVTAQTPPRLQEQHPLLFAHPSKPATTEHIPADRKIPGHSPFAHCAGHDPSHDLLEISGLEFSLQPLSTDSYDESDGAQPAIKHGYATAIIINGTLSARADIMHNGMSTTAQIELRHTSESTPELHTYNDVELVAFQGGLNSTVLEIANPPVAGPVALERRDWWDEKLVPRNGRYHVRITSTTARGDMLFCVEGDLGLRLETGLSGKGTAVCEQH